MKIVWLGVLALASCRGESKPSGTVGSGSSAPVTVSPADAMGSAAPSVDECSKTIAAALAKIPRERWLSKETVVPAEPPLLLVAETVGYEPKTSEVRLKALRGWMVKRGVAATNACKEGALTPTVVAAELVDCVKQECTGSILWVRVADSTILASVGATATAAAGSAGDSDVSARQAAERALHAALDAIVTPWTAK